MRRLIAMKLVATVVIAALVFKVLCLFNFIVAYISWQGIFDLTKSCWLSSFFSVKIYFIARISCTWLFIVKIMCSILFE